MNSVLGITWAASPAENESQHSFNIYECNLEYEIINCIDSIELDFIPYQLTHTSYNTNQDPCFILSGSDNKIHIFCYNQEQTFTEVEADDIFPEFVKELPSIALNVAFKYHGSKRYRNWNESDLTNFPLSTIVVFHFWKYIKKCIYLFHLFHWKVYWCWTGMWNFYYFYCWSWFQWNSGKTDI